MSSLRNLSVVLFLPCLFATFTRLSASVVINEIMYRADEVLPEDLRDEWIELHNPTAAAIDLTGWSFDNGVNFVFPSVSIPAGGYLVIAADVAEFAANFSGVTDVVGPWTGKLSNSGETITLRDALGLQIDEVDFADQGDWATRTRGPSDLGHEGWVWAAAHDGGGRSLELSNPALSNKRGQNWQSSAVAGGTPGAANSTASTDIAPMIGKVAHHPRIPQSTDPVRVTAEIEDELMAGVTATLWYRIDGAAVFASVAMTDDGTGTFSGAIPAQADGTVVEFYVTANDGSQTRTWPAVSQPSGLHLTNCLYQIDDSYDRSQPPVAGAQPEFRLIMTNAERAELAQIGSTPAESDSNAQMNGTLITLDGVDNKTRYRVGIRIRGNGSRNQDPNNYRVNIPRDDKWYGRSAINLNTQYTHSQLIGAEIFRRAGIVSAAAAPVKVSVNGTNLASSGSEQYGSYAFVEPIDGEFAQRRFPADPAGNVYRCFREGGGGAPTGEEADLRWEGNDPNSYRDTYFKSSNSSADDFSDLIGLVDVLNNAPAAGYADAVRGVADLDQWLRHLALDALLANRESGLNTGVGDDYALYRGVLDPRFLLVPHDLDTVLGEGNTPASFTLDIFKAADVAGLSRILGDPDIIPLYYAELLRLMDTIYNPASLDPLIDATLGSWVPVAVTNRMKQFIVDRIANVRSQIPQVFTVGSDLPVTQESYARTTDGGALLNGTFHAGKTRSVLVNGTGAAIDAKAGTWSLEVSPGTGFFKAGINRVLVQAFDDRDGGGAMVDEGYVDVFFDTGSMVDVSGVLVGGAAQGSLNLGVRDSYLPGVPILVRVDQRNDDGSYNHNQWDATAALTTNQPGITLTPDSVVLRNGLGSALVTVSGGSGGVPVTLVQKGSTWNYLDDGTDQGTAWRDVGFDDSTWSSGAAELGYGDGDEATVISFGGDPNNKRVTYYFRRTFEATDTANFTSLTLRLKRDDGAAVYVNGTEVARDGLAAAATYLTFASNGSDEENIFLEFSVDPALLVEGTNTIAAEIHQADASSSDTSFDLELITTTPSVDPGNFTLTATVDERQVSKGITSLGTSPAMTEVSGTLATATWNGVVHVTGDVTVPAGEILTIAPGTLILVDGTAAIQDENGIDFIVRGTVNANGTAQSPVTFTASDPAAPWGWILHEDALPSSYQFTNITRAGHSTRMGHTNTGPALRILGSAVAFVDSSITDIAGKAMQTAGTVSGDSDVTFQRCQLARCSMGPELFDTALLIEDSYVTEMLQQYREDNVKDDNDGIYLHAAAAGQEIRLLRSVLAEFDDDGIDTADSDVTVEDCVIRDVFDKGLSVNGGSVGIVRALVTGASIGMEVKINGATATVDRSTFAGSATAIRLMDTGGGIAISNSIVRGIADSVFGESLAAEALISVAYSNVGETWTGTGNITGDPLFVDPLTSDYHLTATSPCRDAGDPAETDPDASRADMGRFVYDPLFDGGGAPGAGEVRWTAAGGPYHVTANVTVPSDVTLVIDPGSTVYFEPNTEITVNGTIKAVGTPTMRIRMASVPGATFVADIRPELPAGPPRWDGIQIIDSNSTENIVSHVDIEFAQSSTGSIGVIRSEALIDNVTFKGTHQRMVFTDFASVIIQNCVFPDMFAPDEFPIEMSPPIDNAAEHIKGQGGIPNPGYYIVRNNIFGTNKGHNDVIDVDSNQLPNPIMQVLDNVFTGAGDEAIDGGGDILIEGNRFAKNIKDRDNDGTGDSNCVSTGDTLGTVMMMARNVFEDNDHVINFKKGAYGYFENNTVVGITPPHLSLDTDPPSRLLAFSAINFLIPNETNPTSGVPRDPAGRGAYTSSNIFIDVPQSVFGYPDLNPTHGGIVSQLEVHQSIVDSADVFANADNVNGRAFDYAASGARFVDRAGGDFRLLPGTPGIGTGANGLDVGAMVPSGASISGEPVGVTTSDSATLTIGGPGIFSFVYKVNDGAWSSEITISNPRDIASPPLVRSAQVQLTGLPDGDYTVFVRGRNFAGDMQEEAAATASGTWTVASSAAIASIEISEVLAANAGAVDLEGTFPDIIELHNNGTVPYDLSGMSLSDDPALPARFVFASGVILNPDEYLVLYADIGAVTSGIHLQFALDNDGEGVFLYASSANGGGLVDSVSFGLQIPGLSIGRDLHDAAWHLTAPTPGAANTIVPLGDFRTLRINEFLASGEVSFVDDFIELYNPDSLPVALGGLFLTDNHLNEPSKHPIAPLSFVAGGGFAVFKADGNTAAGPAHLSFNLDSSHESVGLYTSDLQEIDLVLYGQQTSDYSVARTSDGSDSFQTNRLPTPGLTEGGVTTMVEQIDLLDVTDAWAYEQSGSDLGTAWRAPGYDDSAWPQGGGLLYLDSDPLPAPKTTALVLGEITYYFRTTFTLDKDPADVALQLSAYIDDGAVFYLNGVEVLRLGMDAAPAAIAFDTLAARTISVASLEGPFSIPTGSLVNGENVLAVEVHQGSAGSSDIVFGLELGATVTSTVSTGDPDYDRALAIFDSLRITEIMFNPEGSDEGFEFIELKNTGSEPIDLAGVRFTDGIGFTFPAMILQPGEYVVLSPDVAKFQSRYGTGINVLGPYTGKLDNGGETILMQLPAPFEAGILRFDYNDWFPETDGGGRSLNLVDATAQRDTWGDRDSWQIGAVSGSPGGNFRIDAGGDRTILMPATLPLTALLTEDGVSTSDSGFALTWQKIAGPGTVTFSPQDDLVTDVEFSVPGTYVIAVEALGNATYAADQLTVTVNDTYEAWAARLGAGLPEDDDDFDGLSNLLEYALELDPGVFDPHPLDIMVIDTELVFDYTRHLRKIDIAYRGESSIGLGVWQSASETLLPGADVDHVPWRVSAPVSPDRQFLRLLIEKP